MLRTGLKLNMSVVFYLCVSCTYHGGLYSVWVSPSRPAFSGHQKIAGVLESKSGRNVYECWKVGEYVLIPGKLGEGVGPGPHTIHMIRFSLLR
jgi:hypothetical protein